MGRLSSGKKNSPTHDQAALPASHRGATQFLPVAAETIITPTKVTPTMTKTATQFLSFPGWRKRKNADYTTPQRPRRSGNTKERDDCVVNTTPSSRDKALPPTPLAPSSLPPLSLDSLNGRTQFQTSGSRDTPPHSASVLVQSSIGLGLQSVIPRALTSSSAPASEVNTIAFSSSSPSQSGANSAPATERFTASPQLDKLVASRSLESERPGDPHRRVRGVSLGPTTLFGRGGTDGKTKEKLVPAQGTLSRKSSFWNRKKSEKTETQSRPATAHGDVSRHSPAPQAYDSDLSQFGFRGQKLEVRDPFSRSFSERPQSYYPTINLNVPIPPKTDRLVRPSTAGNPPSSPERDSPIDLTPEDVARTTSVSFPKVSRSERLPVPRVRSQTNPPLLHRLSLNVFSHSTFLSASPTTPLGSPLLTTAPNLPTHPRRPKPVIIPRPLENEEPPEDYARRLMDAVSKVEVVSILASSAEPFYVAALKAFIEHFDFVGDPLDIALRKLLLEIGLPKETQQIDRVIEGFAKRYIQCNPDLYLSEDHPYILAFSLIMLHTDAFNKSNRHKMTKQEYIKNTRLPGVTPEMLEYFYDNIVFAPFIFIEDPPDSTGQHDLATEPSRLSTVLREAPTSHTSHSATGPSLALKTTKIDPYYLIMNDLLDPLRINVENYVSPSDPFTYDGTSGKWEEEELLLAFSNAQLVEVTANTPRPPPFFGLAAGTSSSALVSGTLTTGDASHEERSTLRVTKIGLMHRKDDVLEGGRKPMNRKWRSCGVVLTGSQLLFSRDLVWVDTLVTQAATGDGKILIPPVNLKVDEFLSVKNAIAVYDKSYTKHRFTFRLVLSDGRHLLLKTSTESDMNQWISRINYVSAFKSAGVRTRLLGMSGRNMHLTGVAAATSHLHDLQNQIHSASNDSATWDDNAPQELLEMLSGKDPVNKRPQVQRVMLKTNRKAVELEDSVVLEAEQTVEFKDTFDQVKADLVAETQTELFLSHAIPLPSPTKELPSPRVDTFTDALSQASSSTGQLRLPSRAHLIEAKIAELDDRLATAQSNLETHTRFIRNIATFRPFQKASRDRIVNAVQTRARMVMELRLDVARVRCHRKVLHDDMIAESRIWKAVKDTALQAAKETLQSRHSPGEAQQGLLSRQFTQPHHGPESSTCESFHTAIDFGPEWPSSDDLGSSFLGTSGMFDSPRPSTSGSFSSFLYLEQDGASPRTWKTDPGLITKSQASSNIPQRDEVEKEFQHEKFYTAQESPVEEAEVWNKTRCAQRVSLVRVPSNLELSPAGKRLTFGLSVAKESEL